MGVPGCGIFGCLLRESLRRGIWMALQGLRYGLFGCVGIIFGLLGGYSGLDLRGVRRVHQSNEMMDVAVSYVFYSFTQESSRASGLHRRDGGNDL